MKRFRLFLTLILMLGLPGMARALAPDSSCTFDRRVGYGAHIRPIAPVPGEPITLVIQSCAECDDVVSGEATDSSHVSVRFRSLAVCRESFTCETDSVEIPLGPYGGGRHRLEIHVEAIVGTPGADSCFVIQQDEFTFVVGGPLPPPDSPLPFVSAIRIGLSPCIDCPPRICPGDSIPVVITGAFPSTCFQFRGLELVPSPLESPLPQPPILRLLVDACLQCPCAAVPSYFEARALLPPLPGADYGLTVQELWIDHRDTTHVDSAAVVTIPFQVARTCSLQVPPPCFLVAWQHEAGPCDAVVDADHPGIATMVVRTSTPLEGLQGALALGPPGLRVIGIEPVGVAASMHVSWNATPDGAKFVLFSTDGSSIAPDSSGILAPVLRVAVALGGGGIPAPVSYLAAYDLSASDPFGQTVPPCLLRETAIVNRAARICFGGLPCDFNHDGIADVRDLVLMVHCIIGAGFCPDTSSAALDCDKDGHKTIDDVLCCARTVLRGGMPDSTRGRPAPEVQVTLGLPVPTAVGLDIPVRLLASDHVGAARLSLRFPSDRYDVVGVDLPQGRADWLCLHEAAGSDLTVGLIGLAIATPRLLPGGTLDVTVHLALRAGQQAGGTVQLARGEFSGADGAALASGFTPASLAIGTGARLMLSAAQPNPFSRATSFSVSVPADADVELSVHDLSGRRVATVFKGRLDAGTRGFTWAGTRDDGGRVRDGIYFVQARGAGTDVTRKLILLRGH